MLISPLIGGILATPDAEISFPAGTITAGTGGTNVVSGTLALGAADAARQIIVAAISGENSTLRTVSSLTVGGSNATFIAAFTHGTSRRIEIWGIDYPTGTSATVTATWTGNSVGLGLLVMRGLNIDISAVEDSASDSGETSPHTGTIDIPAGGVGIAVQNLPSAGSGASSFVGIDASVQAQYQYNSGRYLAGACEAFSAAQSSLSVESAWTNSSSFTEGTFWISLGKL
jgi:hypothetical protein